MKYIVWLAAACATSACADWLTLAGTPDAPDSDSIQVDPRALSVTGAQRTLQIRVNRAHVVADADGLRYRSMAAEATVDCGKRSASYVRKTYYAEPNWSGPPVHQRFFGWRSAPPLQFDGIDGDFPARLIDAACKLEPD